MTNSTIRYGKNSAYDKPLSNNFVISKPHKENNMKQERNDYFEMKQNEMTVTFLFPPNTRKEDGRLAAAKDHSINANIKKEIKNILTTILSEYLTRGGSTR